MSDVTIIRDPRNEYSDSKVHQCSLPGGKEFHSLPFRTVVECNVCHKQYKKVAGDFAAFWAKCFWRRKKETVE